jgi:hypothetical protein
MTSLDKWRHLISEEQEEAAVKLITADGDDEMTLAEIGQRVGVDCRTIIRLMDRRDLWAKDSTQEKKDPHAG